MQWPTLQRDRLAESDFSAEKFEFAIAEIEFVGQKIEFLGGEIEFGT